MAVVYPAVSLFTEGQIWVTQSNGGFLILYSPLACLFFWFCLHFLLSGAEGHRLIFPWPGRLSQPRFFFPPVFCINAGWIIVCKVLQRQHSDLVLSIIHTPWGTVQLATWCVRARVRMCLQLQRLIDPREKMMSWARIYFWSLSCPLTKGFAVLHGGVTGRSSTNESPQFDNLISDNSNEFLSPFSQTVSFIWQQMLQAAPVCEPLVQNLLTTPYVCH